MTNNESGHFGNFYAYSTYNTGSRIITVTYDINHSEFVLIIMGAATNGGSWRAQIITSAHNATSQSLHYKNWLGEFAAPVGDPTKFSTFTIPHNGWEHYILLGSCPFTFTLTS